MNSAKPLDFSSFPTVLLFATLLRLSLGVASARVVLYSTEWCGYCKQIRRFLDQKGVPYQAFDIEKDAQARKAYEALGGGGIPFVEVNGTLIRDYNPDAIMAALK